MEEGLACEVWQVIRFCVSRERSLNFETSHIRLLVNKSSFRALSLAVQLSWNSTLALVPDSALHSP
jgi:hypothetical protein